MKGLLLAVVLAGLFAELFARSAARGAFADIWLKEPMLQRKDGRMRVIARRRPLVVFLGSSESMCAVDPTVLKEHYGITSYNAGVFRGMMTYVNGWAGDFVLRRLKPRLVVVEVWPPILNDNSEMTGHHDDYAGAPYFTSRRRLRFLYEAGHWLVLLRLLPLLARPVSVLKLIVQVVKHPQWWTYRRPLSLPGVIGDGGQSVEHDLRGAYRTGPRLEAIFHEIMTKWTVGGHEWQALISIVERCRQRGASVVFLEPPYTADLPRKYFPGGEAAWEDARQRIFSLSEGLGVRWLHPAGEMKEEQYFADPVHANLAGKTRFSVALGEVLVAELDKHSRGLGVTAPGAG